MNLSMNLSMRHALSARWHVSMNYNKYLTDQASTVRASYIAHSNNL